MIPFLFALLVVSGVAYHVSTPEERQRIFKAVLAGVGQLRAAEQRRRADLAPFREKLRARTGWVVVTPAIAGINFGVFAGMVFGAGAVGDPATLLSWGGSLAFRTSNGEWWRLLTSVFVHTGFIHVLVCVGGVLQVGLLLERIVGRLAFAAVYAGAGTIASVLVLAQQPMVVSTGSSGAVFGVYGLLVAVAVVGLVQKSAIAIPFRALKVLAPAVGLFLLYELSSDRLDSTATTAAFGAGLAGGLALTLRAADRTAPLRRTAASACAAMLIIIGAAIPLRGVMDVRPALAQIVDMEKHTAARYWSVIDRFRQRKMTGEALAEIIDTKIRPELDAALARVVALTGVLPEQRPLVAAAEEYCRLREESWRLRAEGVRKTNMLKLRQAESVERTALQALKRLEPSE